MPIDYAKMIEAVLHFLKKFWYLVPMFALAFALLMTRSTLSRREHTIAAQVQTISNLNARNAITQKSLTGALDEINGQNADADAAAARLQADRLRAAYNEAALTERSKGTDGMIAALQTSSKTKGADKCAVSPTALKALEGL